MGKSLNVYASRIAHLVGQPDNQSLKERVKDMIKDYFAKYIIQSIDRNGIQPYYKIPLVITMIPVESSKVTSDVGNSYYLEYKSKTKVPQPLNIKNDSPFTRVSIPETVKLFSYVPLTVLRISVPLASTGSILKYSYVNNEIYVRAKIPNSKLEVREIWDKTDEEGAVVRELELEAVWENPEEVIGYYLIEDNQDLELPFPSEMLNFVIADLLKVEFNITPKDDAVDNK